MMFPWTSVSQGTAMGCCGGAAEAAQRGFENCLEQHITPDISFFLQQVFWMTEDLTWLKNQAWKVIHGVARWIVSRVHLNADHT